MFAKLVQFTCSNTLKFPIRCFSRSTLSEHEKRQYERNKTTINKNKKQDIQQQKLENNIHDPDRDTNIDSSAATSNPGSPPSSSSSIPSSKTSISVIERIVSVSTNNVRLNQDTLQIIKQYEQQQNKHKNKKINTTEHEHEHKNDNETEQQMDTDRTSKQLMTDKIKPSSLSEPVSPPVRWRRDAHPQRGSAGLNRRQRKFLKLTKKRANKSTRLNSKQRSFDNEEEIGDNKRQRWRDEDEI
jgi:hypothetical protein